MNIDYNYKTNELNINISPRTGECNHNPNRPDTTLMKFNKTTMTSPYIVNFVCSSCGEHFKFIKHYKYFEEYQEPDS